MYCTGCGQEIDVADIFCAKCGKAASKNVTNKASSLEPTDTTPPAKTTEKRVIPSWGFIFLYIGVSLAIIGCIAGVVIPELAGKKASGGSLTALAFWIGVATAIRGKQIGKSVWLWFLIGFLGIGLIAVCLISFITPFFVR